MFATYLVKTTISLVGFGIIWNSLAVPVLEKAESDINAVVDAPISSLIDY